jgi:hypothetical protein
MRLARTLGLAAGLAMVGSMAVPGVAQATPPVENDHYEDAFTGSFDDCGFTITYDVTTSGHFMSREVEGSDGQAFLAQDNFEVRNVLTNPETGAFMVERGHGLFKELSGRQIAGNIWEFTTHSIFNRVLEDSEGNIVARESGLVTSLVVFDTLGDGQPGGIVLEEEITGVHGPHPVFEGFCEIATDLIG